MPFLESPAKLARLKLLRHQLYETSGIISAEYAVVYAPAPKATRRKKGQG